MAITFNKTTKMHEGEVYEITATSFRVWDSHNKRVLDLPIAIPNLTGEVDATTEVIEKAKAFDRLAEIKSNGNKGFDNGDIVEVKKYNINTNKGIENAGKIGKVFFTRWKKEWNSHFGRYVQMQKLGIALSDSKDADGRYTNTLWIFGNYVLLAEVSELKALIEK